MCDCSTEGKNFYRCRQKMCKYELFKLITIRFEMQVSEVQKVEKLPFEMLKLLNKRQNDLFRKMRACATVSYFFLGSFKRRTNKTSLSKSELDMKKW